MDSDRPYEPADPGASATPEPPPGPPPAPTPPATPPAGQTPPTFAPGSPGMSDASEVAGASGSSGTSGASRADSVPPAPPPTAYAKPGSGFDMAQDWPALAAMLSGVVAVGMMFPDWSVSKLFRQEEGVNGFNRDLMPAAPIMLVILLAAIVAIAGYTLLTRQPRLLVLAAVPAFTALMVIIVMMTTLSEIGDSILGSIPGGSFELGVGAYLCLVFTLAALCLSLYPLIGMLRRPAGLHAAPPRPTTPPRNAGEWTATDPTTRTSAPAKPAEGPVDGTTDRTADRPADGSADGPADNGPSDSR